MIVNQENMSKAKKYSREKRFFDFTLSLLGVLLISPILLVIVIIMKINEPKGKIIFKQKRIGKGGNIFYIYKFRSMRNDADRILRENNELYEKYIQNGYKLDQEEDPRITKLGSFLRKTSLDELPQLINVIKGDMSLVGPRPIIEEELKEYELTNTVNEFLSMKPGITGVWQVSGRSNIGYPERVYLEISYLNYQSITKDMKILFLTIFKVLIREGAY